MVEANPGTGEGRFNGDYPELSVTVAGRGKKDLPAPKGDTERWFPELGYVENGKICLPGKVRNMLQNALYDHAIISLRRQARLERDKKMLMGTYVPAKVGRPGLIEELDSAIKQEEKEQEAIVRIFALLEDARCD